MLLATSNFRLGAIDWLIHTVDYSKRIVATETSANAGNFQGKNGPVGLRNRHLLTKAHGCPV